MRQRASWKIYKTFLFEKNAMLLMKSWHAVFRYMILLQFYNTAVSCKFGQKEH